MWDTMGASLSLIPILQPWFSAGGSFSACNRGESAGPTLNTLGERFSFIYPTWPIIGRMRNNTFFEATGNRGGRLQLLCHTTQAELDPDICYAYINLETLRAYMLEYGFFTSFVANMPANVWHFAHAEPLARITSPSHNEGFHVGEVLTVKASIQDVREATLYINGRTIETRVDLAERDVIFSGYTLTDTDVGNLSISVEALNGQWITVNLPPVQIRVAQSQVPEPYVWLVEPYDGDSFNVGDTIRVGAFIEGITQAELRIGNYRQATTHPFNYRGYNIMFDPYTFTVDDVGTLPITVTGTNSGGQTATDSVIVKVAPTPMRGRVIEIPTIMSGRINGEPWSRNIQERWFSWYRMTGASPIDIDGFYQIAVGPRVLEPDYPDTGRIWASDFNFPYRIDAILEHRTTGEQKLLECITHSSGKAHTFNRYPHDLHPRNNLFLPGTTASFDVDSGIHQTGVAYPLSWNAANESQFDLNHLDGSTIEFMNNGVDFSPNDYRLLRIIVHD